MSGGRSIPPLFSCHEGNIGPFALQRPPFKFKIPSEILRSGLFITFAGFLRTSFWKVNEKKKAVLPRMEERQIEEQAVRKPINAVSYFFLISFRACAIDKSVKSRLYETGKRSSEKAERTINEKNKAGMRYTVIPGRMQRHDSEDRSYAVECTSIWDKKYWKKIARRQALDGGLSVFRGRS